MASWSDRSVNNTDCDIKKIFIVLPNGKTIDLNVKASDEISKIKHAIQKQTKIAVEQQSIMFEGKVLRHDSILNDYNTKNESKLLVVVRVGSYAPLGNMLKQNNLYDDLFEILAANSFDLEMLENDVKQDEIENLCNNLKFDPVQRTKFRKLMRIIYGKGKMKAALHITVAVIGDSSVGKTCLIRRYIEDRFNPYEKSSIGVGSYSKTETLADNTNVKVDIYDTGGQERFNSICSGYYKKADVMLMCYAVDEKKSFDRCEYWRKQIEDNTYSNHDPFVILVACKRDLLESDNKDAEAILQHPNWTKYNAVFCECSAKSGDNVRNVFLTAAEVISERRRENDVHDNIQQDERDNDEEKNLYYRENDQLREENKVDNNAAYVIPRNGRQQENVDVEQALAKKVDKKSSCFSSESYVLTYPDFKQKQVDELRIHDKILTFDALENKFYWDELLVKLHFEENEYLNDVMVEMRELILDNDNKLVMTDNHLLYVKNKGLCRMDEVIIGDKLKQFDGGNVTVVVVNKYVMKRPRNLITYNGNLVINGVAISTFTDTIWGENKCWGKALRYVVKYVNSYRIWRYHAYCVATVWNVCLSVNIKQAVMKFYLDD